MLCYDVLMSRVIPQRELRNQSASIMRAVADGESFIVTHNGSPVAELRPLTEGRRFFVPKAQLLATAAEGPHVDAARFRSDIDRLVDQSL